jgi:hypothetical protein
VEKHLLGGRQHLQALEVPQRLEESRLFLPRHPGDARRHVRAAVHARHGGIGARGLEGGADDASASDGAEHLLHPTLLERGALGECAQPPHLGEHLLLRHHLACQPEVL